MSRFSRATHSVSNSIRNVVSNPNRLVTAVGTGGLSELVPAVAPGTTNFMHNKFDPAFTVGSAAMLAYGGGAALMAGGAGAEGIGAGGLGSAAGSGGLPLMTKVLLGVDVASALAGYFGRKPGPDFTGWYNGLNADDKKQIDQLQKNMTDIQTNVNAREKALSDITEQYPQIMAQNLKDVSTTLGPQIDDISKQFMSRTADQLAAKFNSQGGFSSGAFNEGLSKAAVDLNAQKTSYLMDAATKLYSQRYNEAASGLSFQRKMLGDTSDNLFHAGQNELDRATKVGENNAKIAERRNESENAATEDLFGSVGRTIGTGAALYAMGGGGRSSAPGPAGEVDIGGGRTWNPNFNPYGM